MTKSNCMCNVYLFPKYMSIQPSHVPNWTKRRVLNVKMDTRTKRLERACFPRTVGRHLPGLRPTRHRLIDDPRYRVPTHAKAAHHAVGSGWDNRVHHQHRSSGVRARHMHARGESRGTVRQCADNGARRPGHGGLSTLSHGTHSLGKHRKCEEEANQEFHTVRIHPSV